MKKLFTIIALFVPVLLFAQKKAGKLIKKHFYVKVSPTLFAGDGVFRYGDGTGFSPAILGTAGAKIRYVALGFSAGHLRFTKGGNVTPLGADLTITDFKRKTFPVITVQWHQAHYSTLYEVPATGFRNNMISGKDMQSIGAGMAFTVLKRSKLLATLGVSRLNYNLQTFISISPDNNYINNYKKYQNLPFIAVSMVL